MRVFALRLILVFGTIGGVATIVFLVAASQANHANAFLLFAMFSPVVIFLSLIGVVVGVSLLLINYLKK